MIKEHPIKFRVYEGPNLIVPHAAVVAEFVSPISELLSTTRLIRRLKKILPAKVVERVALPTGKVTFELAFGELTKTLLDLAGPSELPVEVQSKNAGSALIVIGFRDDPQVAIRTSSLALRITCAAITAAPEEILDQKTAAGLINQTGRMMAAFQPDITDRNLMRTARERGIPVYSVSPASGIWQYGQGSCGQTYRKSANQDNSLIGATLARNKVLSNQLVNRLGLPGVNHRIARAPEDLKPIVKQLGFPLVAKPVDGWEGIGVTAGITTIDELRDAYSEAKSHSSFGVIIETHIPGDDHRLVVLSGKLKWVVQRIPPQVIGNGESTIAELIDIENRNRGDADVAAGTVTRLEIDSDMLSVLDKQGLKPDDCPTLGRTVRLRSIANVAKGATIKHRMADVHPDNREMAETIARCFHLDTVGIDFIISDISKSWHDLNCAVIEVNDSPGIHESSSLHIALSNKFPPDSDGRIPSIVLIGADDTIFDFASSAVEAHIECVGKTDRKLTFLGEQRRCIGDHSLYTRVQSLLLDVSCEALVIQIKSNEIEESGFPLDRCDIALVMDSESISNELSRLIDGCAKNTKFGVSRRNFEQCALPLITEIFGSKIPHLSNGD